MALTGHVLCAISPFQLSSAGIQSASLNSSIMSVSYLRRTDSSRSSDVSSLNHQGQARHICLGFLMGFLLIDWGEEFRAMLDWLFSSKLQETGLGTIRGCLLRLLLTLLLQPTGKHLPAPSIPWCIWR